MPPKPRKPPPRKQSGNRNLLIAAGAAAAVVLVLVGASLLLRGGDSIGGGGGSGGVTGIEEASTLLDGIPQDRAVLGAPKAKVTLIQFEDLQCPICRRTRRRDSRVWSTSYVRPGKVKLRIRRDGLHRARLGEGAALHARRGEQGKLWQFQDALYANQGERTPAGYGRRSSRRSRRASGSTGRSSRRTRTAP